MAENQSNTAKTFYLYSYPEGKKLCEITAHPGAYITSVEKEITAESPNYDYEKFMERNKTYEQNLNDFFLLITQTTKDASSTSMGLIDKHDLKKKCYIPLKESIHKLDN